MSGPTLALRRHIDGLDGIRAIAALSVLIFHFTVMRPLDLPEPIATIAGYGWVGVNIFFAVSGFILFLPYARAALVDDHVATGRFLRNRMLRIVPALWFQLAVLVLAYRPDLLFTPSGQWTVIQNLTLVAGYLPPHDRHLLNDVTWTLSLEIVFYLTLPFVARFFVRNRWMIAFPIVLAFGMTFTYLVAERFGDDRFTFQTLISSIVSMYPEFGVGMVAAAIWAKAELRQRELPKWLGASLALGGLVAMYGVILILKYGITLTHYWKGTGVLGWLPVMVIPDLVAACAAVMIFGACYTPNFVTAVLNWRPIAFLGAISYGIYLWHYMIGKWLMAGMDREDTAHQGIVLMLVGTALTVGVAWFSYVFVERPFLRRKKVASATGTSADPELVTEDPPTRIDPTQPVSVSVPVAANDGVVR